MGLGAVRVRSDAGLDGRALAHVASVRFLKFSVKVVRHKDGLYFVGSLWKKTMWRIRPSDGSVIPIFGVLIGVRPVWKL